MGSRAVPQKDDSQSRWFCRTLANVTRQKAGFKAKIENETILEKEVCIDHGLTQVTDNKNRTKTDGTDEAGSTTTIKNSKSRSTQCHLTSWKRWVEQIPGLAEVDSAMQKFLGGKGSTKESGRLNNQQIPKEEVQLNVDTLNKCKSEINRLVIGTEVTQLIWRDTKFEKDYVVSVTSLFEVLDNSVWVAAKGTYALMYRNKRVLHLQRKGTGSNALQCHLYKNACVEAQ